MGMAATQGNPPASSEMLARLEADLDGLLEARASVWPRRSHPAYRALKAALETYTNAVCTLAGERPALWISEELQAATERFRNHPVFIVGAPKSGTTLVRNLLDGHPELVVLPSEGQYWATFLRRFGRATFSSQIDALGRIWVERFINPDGQPPLWLLGKTRADRTNSYVDFIRYLTAWAHQLQGRGSGNLLLALALAFHAVTKGPANGRAEDGATPVAWVEKTPLNELYLDLILTSFPRARFIHVVRDPRAIVSSRRTLKAYRGPTRHSLVADCLLLRRSFAGGARNLRRLGTRRYHVLRYEDLVQEPVEAVRHLADFLGVEDDASLTRPSVMGRPASSNSAYPHLRVPGRIYDEASRRFVDVLNAREQLVIEGVLRREAGRFGYEWPAPPRPALIMAVARAGIEAIPFYFHRLKARLNS